MTVSDSQPVSVGHTLGIHVVGTLGNLNAAVSLVRIK